MWSGMDRMDKGEEDRIPQNTIAERGPRVHGEGVTGGGGETVGVRLHVL